MKPNSRELQCIEYRQELLEPDPFIRSVKLRSEEEIAHDSTVSGLKTFSQLWEDHGVHEIGVPYYRMKQNCMQRWVEILYDTDLDLEKITQEMIDEQVKTREAIPGIRINFAPPVQMLPEIIDSRLGPYA